MKIGIQNGKLLIKNNSLHLVDEGEPCCCTNGECVLYCIGSLKLRRHCDTPPPAGYPNYPDGPPIPMTHWRYNNCHRLLVYENVEICNNRIRSWTSSPDYVIITNSSAEGPYESGPYYGAFYVTYNDPESGILDEQPYWWEDCGVGGWQTTSTPSLLPTLQNIHDKLDCCGSTSPGPAEVSNGLYRMYILMTYRRSYQKGGTKNPESTSAAWLDWIRLSYISSIEDCDFEEIERGECPNTSYPPACE